MNDIAWIARDTEELWVLSVTGLEQILLET